jgi:ABC-type uncharacterized transport system YnjBCD ATPase subunit
LRLPNHLSAEVIRLIVEQTIDELGLRDAADTVVGGPLRKGISGGEKRRLSIGCVLVTLPSVLILDVSILIVHRGGKLNIYRSQRLVWVSRTCLQRLKTC